MSRPDVALVGAYPRRGERADGVPGIAAYTAALAGALADSGARVTVVAPSAPGQSACAMDGAVRVERRFAASGPRALSDALAAAEATGAQVVHLQLGLSLYGGTASIPGLLWALRRAAANDARTVVTLHHVLDPSAGAPPGLARGAMLRSALAAVQGAVSRLAGVVVVHEGALAERVPGAVVIPHGVERLAPGDRAASRALLGLDERPAVLCFGALAPGRGLEVALDAAERTRGAVSLVIADAGSGRLRSAGDTYAARLRDRYQQTPAARGAEQLRYEHTPAPGGAEQLRHEGAGTVRFVGRVPAAEVGTWFDAADLALFLSPQACPTSATLALALAHGTPFLLSGPAAEAIGAPGLAVSDDPAALAAHLAWLVDEPRRVAALRRAVRSLAAARSWPVVADRHLALYQRLQGEAQAGSPVARRLRAA